GVKKPPSKDHPNGRPYSRSYEAPEDYWRLNPNDHDWKWSRHSWTLQDNVSVPHLWEDALRIKKQNGWADDHPTWQREYLGKWVASDSAFVYAFASLVHTDPDLVTWEPDRKKGFPLGLPHEGPWYYVMGMDMGF